MPTVFLDRTGGRSLLRGEIECREASYSRSRENPYYIGIFSQSGN
jgi:hypothetical protein